MKWIFLCPTLLLILGLGACKKKREVSVYTVQKQESTNSPANANSHDEALPAVDDQSAGNDSNPHAGMKMLAAPTFSDEVPAHWKKMPQTAMRMASYQVQGEGDSLADVSFTSLRSAAGGFLANMNRWREQVGQSAWSETQVKESTESVATYFGDGRVVDVEGKLEGADSNKDGRIIGAIVEKDGRAWFYKMRGNAVLVGKEKANFIKWIESLKPSEVIKPVPAAVSRHDLSWKLPDGWVVDFGGESRYATIEIPADQKPATQLVVSFFPGDVGGDLANVNRWLGQLAMESVDEAELSTLIQSLSAGSKAVSMVDLKGSEKRMFAAWTKHAGQTWFFKWTGEEAMLERGKSSFVSFVESLRFNTPES